MKYSLRFLILLAFVPSLIQCSDDKIELTTPVQIRLTDARAQYDQVNIDIQSIQIHSSSDSNTENGWQELDLLKAGVYDLLHFNNGLDTLLVNQDFASGTVSQMRLLLGDNNSVVIDGTSFPLSTPSAQTSGLKFQIHDDFLAGIDYHLWIDFDAARSIVASGNGNYKLKPVIRTFNEATSGAISGTILPEEAQATVHAIINTDTISTIAESNGTFLIRGLSSGSYHIKIEPVDAYQEKVVDNVAVKIGEITSLGNITLDPVAQ